LLPVPVSINWDISDYLITGVSGWNALGSHQCGATLERDRAPPVVIVHRLREGTERNPRTPIKLYKFRSPQHRIRRLAGNQTAGLGSSPRTCPQFLWITVATHRRCCSIEIGFSLRFSPTTITTSAAVLVGGHVSSPSADCSSLAVGYSSVPPVGARFVQLPRDDLGPVQVGDSPQPHAKHLNSLESVRQGIMGVTVK
jgi:hypothetical protein